MNTSKMYILLLLMSTLSCEFIQATTRHLETIFTNQQLKKDIASFIDHVLRQVPSQKFMHLMRHMPNKFVDDTAYYTYMRNNYSRIQPGLPMVKQFQLLSFQKKMLRHQIRRLLPKNQTFQNCLEIGTPGTYASTIKKQITGDIYVVGEQPRITDVLQANSWNISQGFKGYDHFLPLTYDPIDNSIADTSIDLVICFIGLHHCPEHKLNAFIDSIKRVLKPGGTLLLREHNAHTPELKALTYAAHSIFNIAIPQESLETELQELRNFQSLHYWIDLLQTHGFEVGAERLLQHGDSTLNTLIKCTRKCETFGDTVFSAHAQGIEQHKDYKRDEEQTYLTSPEWINVDIAEQYAKFIEHTPFYEFPYMESVQAYWKVFGKSWQEAAQKKGHLQVMTSPYTLMNMFIGLSMTAEFTAKSAVSWPIRLMYSGAETQKLVLLIHDPERTITDTQMWSVRQKLNNNLLLLEVPRYKEFIKAIQLLKAQPVTLIKIAGNDHILCKIRYSKDTAFAPQTDWKLKFTWSLPTQKNMVYATYAVPVTQLFDFMNMVTAQHAELLYIHDF